MNKWIERRDSLAAKIDIAIFNNDITALNRYRDELTSLISEKKNTPEFFKSTLTYYLANIYQHLGLQSNDIWDNPNLGQSIICHRKFYRYEFKDDSLTPKVEVNHANTLKVLCRILEAIPLWKKGTMYHGEAGEVSLYRLADGLLSLSLSFYDEDCKYYYQLYAYNYIKKLLSKANISHDGIRAFVAKDSDSLIAKFLEYAGNSFDKDADLSQNSYRPSYSKEEKKYRAWCKDNVLFLNPLNDLEGAWIVDHDILNFPTYRTSFMEGPYFSASFSSMKNEYCYYRHLFYEGINNKYTKFTDKDKYLTDTLDGVIYDGYIEKIKNALKGCFSVLDKISRLLDKYYELESKKVGFNREWFDKQDKLKAQENPFLTALFWLSKDFSQHDKDQRRPSYWLDDAAFEVRELRNELEHGWVRVIDSKLDNWCAWDANHDYAYKISSNEIKDKGLYVIKQTRHALIYLCLAINFTEKMKKRDDAVTVECQVPII